MRRYFLPALTAFLILSVPTTASAHGVDGAAGRSVPEFVWLGITHMLLGWDHLLFVAGVALIAGTARRAAAYVSLFALGHSVTLITAAITEWRVSPTKVDLVIRLSVIFVGAVALLARPKTKLHWRLFGATVLGFGLVHGLGLATRLQDIDVHGVGSLTRIVAFNVGIEGGQVIALIVVALIASYLPARFTSEKAQRVASTGIIVLGILAATLVVLDRVNRPAPVAASGPCASGERVDTLPVGQGGHPAKDFYEPTESSPLKDFGHVLGDAFVIVQYQPTLPVGQVDELRTFITSKEGNKVTAGPRPDQTALLTATHVRGTLTCTAFDLPALQQFVRTWFADPRSKTAE
ncbi:HupE/UreJ family protein [Dactylosporangium sp. AC04546]|uniref:HupE/UreJ family protein n=1 Tax=Dactylosporangium sp. AC04546 TaxID=2862460 RepID=UPI001EDE0018|nr:HupE/UreJ family protein [Dactylosporangium sp. AC04546]WVK86487.1 HupE/UreJ family protein [Dactylosporangium sp. AC04546]